MGDQRLAEQLACRFLDLVQALDDLDAAGLQPDLALAVKRHRGLGEPPLSSRQLVQATDAHQRVADHATCGTGDQDDEDDEQRAQRHFCC